MFTRLIRHSTQPSNQLVGNRPNNPPRDKKHHSSNHVTQPPDRSVSPKSAEHSNESPLTRRASADEMRQAAVTSGMAGTATNDRASIVKNAQPFSFTGAVGTDSNV